ncbi:MULTISPECIES: hypothetical protein [unclassified Streptomyces]|uniref:Uncharacterized protein n=1 Tax=Streptomyces sp. NBC_00060 TaxID=2975636 RepID=A0AAU2H446_9ACTN
MGSYLYPTDPPLRYPESAKIPGVRLWLEDLDDIYGILCSGAQRASIHPGDSMVHAVADLKMARTRDLNHLQFRAEGPSIVIDFRTARVDYSADVEQYLKTEINNVFRGARRTWVRRFWDAQSAGGYAAAFWTTLFCYKWPWMPWVMFRSLIQFSWFQEFESSMPRRYHDLFPAAFSATMGLLSMLGRQRGSVKVLPYSRGDFRQWMVQANLGLLASSIILVVGIPVALLTAWLTGELSLSP